MQVNSEAALTLKTVWTPLVNARETLSLLLASFDGAGFDFLDVPKLAEALETFDDAYAVPRDKIAETIACHNLVRPLPKDKDSDVTRESLLANARDKVEKLGATLPPALGVRVNATAKK